MRHRTGFIAVVLFSIASASNLAAQLRSPEFALTPVYDSPRSHAPIQLDAKLSWSSVDILMGRLQLEFYNGQRRFHTWISREVVLSANDVTLSVMAPPGLLKDERGTLSVRATFISGDAVHDLKVHDVPYWGDFKRAFTIGIIHPEGAGLPPGDFTTPFQDRFAWLEPFRIDDTLPNSGWARHLSCRSMAIDSDRVPEDPLELLAFDLLILTNAGLNDLDEEQLDAVAGWVEAGGALCVAGARAGTQPRREFLSRVADSLPYDPSIEFDGEGNIRPLVAHEHDWALTSPGVGRAIVTFGPVEVRQPEWRDSMLSLWRVRPGQISHVRNTGHWDYPVEHEYYLQQPNFLPLRPETLDEPEGLQTILLPERVEGVPLATVALLLLACLLAVAPGDYFLLGWLKRRRWTWILFPSIALGFAIFTVRLAQSHMGQTDHRTTLTFVDLARDGRVVRGSQFELLFAASDKQIEQQLSAVVVSPMEYRERVLFQADNFRRDPTLDVTPPAPPVTPAIVTGRMPLSYSHLRSLRQWTPRLTRYTTMGPREDVEQIDLDWSLVDVATLRDPAQRQALLDELGERFPEGAVVLVNGNSRWKPAGTPDAREPGNQPDNSPPGPPGTGTEGDAAEQQSRQLPIDFAVRVSGRPVSGMFRVVSQISPNAAGNLEDLALFDKSDPRQWLLIIVLRDADGNVSVYRRLIRDNSA